MATTRLLQVIADTDADPVNAGAVELHAALAASGLEVRTLALAPGTVGGLHSAVPTIAHSRNSFAARGGLRGELRWADAMILHGERSLAIGSWPSRSAPPWVLHLPGGPAGFTGGGPSWLARRLAQRANAVVVDDEHGVRNVTDRFGVDAASVVVATSPIDWVRLLADLT